MTHALFVQLSARSRSALFSLGCIGGLLCSAAPLFAAGGGPGGQDLLHVPISWCPVIGSPAQANPNISGDTQTDDVIWRRHERPTDNIYINTAGVTFRSAINNAWTVLDFPQIADPDTTLGTPGDMRGENVNTFGVEYNAMLSSCDAAYTALGRSNVGVTAINAGLFHDATGAYIGVIGWGGCSQPAGQANVPCSAPFDGRIAVIDNAYLHPSSPDRTFPGSTMQFTITDPLDALVAHELGHALGLDHITNPTLLMNPGMADNDGDGQVDNIAFAAGQTGVVRSSSMIVQGLEIDPPLQVNPGDFVADRVMDLKDDQDLKPIHNIASVRLSLDKKLNRVFITNQLTGAHPKRGGGDGAVHWMIVDSEEGDGATQEHLDEIGLKHATITGAEIVIRVEARYPETVATAWRWNGKALQEIPRVFSQFQTLIMHPWFAPADGIVVPRIGAARVYDTMMASLPAKVAGIALDRPVAVDVIIESAEGQFYDRIDGEPRDRILVMEDPDFPHCYALETGKPGGAVPVLVEGLLPGKKFHALVGPDLVTEGELDTRGTAEFTLPIPGRIRDGLHLVTVGVDGTALTADCPVQIGEPRGKGEDTIQPPRVVIDPRLELLRRHQDLLQRSLDAFMDIERLSK